MLSHILYTLSENEVLQLTLFGTFEEPLKGLGI